MSCGLDVRHRHNFRRTALADAVRILVWLDFHGDCGATMAGCGVHPEGPVGQIDPLAHQRQPKVRVLSHQVRVESGPVIMDLKLDGTIAAGHRHLDVRGVGVLADVGKRLLRDPI
jgi:hypothetical protein